MNIRYVFSPEAEKIKQVIKYAEEKLDDEYMLIQRKIAEYTNENCLCPEKDKDKLEKKIKQGKSSHDIAMTFDVHPSTVRRKAKEFGLEFKSKSVWRKL